MKRIVRGQVRCREELQIQTSRGRQTEKRERITVLVPDVPRGRVVREQSSSKKKTNLNHQTNIRGKEGRGFIRSILSFSKKDNTSIIRELTIRDRFNNYTKEYIYLTKQFYFKNLG